jgi:hypothetical protein
VISNQRIAVLCYVRIAKKSLVGVTIRLWGVLVRRLTKNKKDGCWGIRGSGLCKGAKEPRITKDMRPGESRREYKKRINGGWLKD